MLSIGLKRSIHNTMSEQPAQLSLIERIERALVLLAYFIERDGDVHVPMYEKFEAELEELKKKEDTKARARERLLLYLDSSDELKIETRITAIEFEEVFGALSDKVGHEPVMITKDGRDSLVVISAKEWKRLKRRDCRVGLTLNLPEGWAEAVRRAKVPEGFTHLDPELK